MARHDYGGLIIKRVGISESVGEDFYHRFLRTSWFIFFLEIIGFYLLFNIFFACIYYFATPGGITNILDQSFWYYFFFSVQTSATIGYGHYFPNNFLTHLIVVFEAILSLILTAVLTGLIFARFSRPVARILFSKNILWVKYNQKPALMMRLGNARVNRIYEARAKWTLLKDYVTPEGDKIRKLFDLKLTRNETSLFALSWTLIHIIDEESPFHNLDLETLKGENLELMVTVSGLDQDTAQTLSSHRIYHITEVQKAKKFKDIIRVDGAVREINFADIDTFE